MAALQFVNFPNYNALLLRRTFSELSQAGALMDRARAWLTNKDARWNQSTHSWTFPSGATLRFGYMDTEADRYQYQSSEYQFIGFDEATEFTELMYTWMFSRCRKLKDEPYPLRVRAASNPGGIGHAWVKQRFISNPEGRRFYPANFTDNPHLDREEYFKNLQQLDPVTRQQLINGDWDAWEGGRFERSWFKTYKRDGPWYIFDDRKVLYQDLGRFITVDPAATPEDTTQKRGDSDYTAIGTYARPPWEGCVVLDMVRERIPINRIVDRIEHTCEVWEPLYVGIEALAFQAALLHDAKRRAGIPNARALDPRVLGKNPNIRMKLARAIPAIIWASEGKIWVPEKAPWLKDFLDEICLFTGDPDLDAHDDQVDSLAYAVQELKRGGFVPGKPLEDRVTPRCIDPHQMGGTSEHMVRRGMFGIGKTKHDVRRL